MSIIVPRHPYERSGLAALSDLDAPEHRMLLSQLETDQGDFLAKEAEFRSPTYRWPRDALHTWSRVWEYPYVYYHLKQLAASSEPGSLSRVVDLGSAVTFFPFSVATLGYDVQCLDIDCACAPDIERLARLVDHRPGSVAFRLISNARFPLEDSEIDALYCVSVLEHIPDFEHTIAEVFRVLKPHGVFILTIDLDLCGYQEISVSRYYDLRNLLCRRFELQKPEITVHPFDLLQARNSRFPLWQFSVCQRLRRYAKQRIKAFFGRTPLTSLPNLAVAGFVMARTA